jgi:hypothetical protein
MIQARNISISRTLLASVMCLLLLPTIAFAKSEKAEPVGHMSPSASAVQWQPSVENEKIVLRVVAPDGTTYTREFVSGSTPSLRVQDLGAGKINDGVYTYELLVIPRISAEVKRQLAAARAADDDAAAERIQKAAGIGQTLTQSGTLTIANGAFSNADAEEPGLRSIVRLPTANSTTGSTASTLRKITPNDQVIADDLIVQGSECVGLDCVINESFGFDTIRLKENNTRIKFQDTSTAAGFPTHDWQLTANDSASGGAEKFSIEDITAATVPFTVTGSAPTNGFFMDSTGRVGLRTGTPVLDFHVATGNTPAHRFEQTSAGGFTAQTWDIAGNEANFFVRDVTGGSRLPFRIRPGAPTSSIDISAVGAVGIGTASPNSNAKLDINGALRMPGVTYPTTDNGAWIVNETGAGLAMQSAGTLRLKTGGTTDRVLVDATGNVGINCNAPGSQLVIASGSGCSTPSSSINAGSAQFTIASSRTFKENLAPVTVPDILQKIASINVYNYDFIKGPKDRVGLMAEDFHQIFSRGSEKYIDGGEVQMALWLAVQQLAARNSELTQRITTLESALAAQSSRPQVTEPQQAQQH